MFMFLGRNLEKKTGGANDWLKANGAEKTEGVVGTRSWLKDTVTLKSGKQSRSGYSKTIEDDTPLSTVFDAMQATQEEEGGSENEEASWEDIGGTY
eukprot:gene28090-11824_t